MWSFENSERKASNCCSVALGGDASTMGRAGETILPPTVTDRGGASLIVIVPLLVGFDMRELVSWVLGVCHVLWLYDRLLLLL